ncbi:unnamed protein product, partial [marine sediment metagenome]
MNKRLSSGLRLTVIFLAAIFASGQVAHSGEFPPAPEGTFSIAVIPDTQHYRTDAQTSAVENPVFESYVDWVAENLDEQRIAFVTHVGDIVDINNRDQWTVARAMMDRLHGRIPYGISVGNHDMVRAGDSSLFQEFFAASRYEQFGWYGGYFPSRSEEPAISGNNANSFQLFSAADFEFVILHLECNAPDDVLAWADRIL